MSLNYEELDFQQTSIGDLMLRRRRMPQFKDLDIYEVKLGEQFLMTSLFHESEDQVAKLGLKALDKNNLDVVVGGLGLGYTAAVALEDKRISKLSIVEYLDPVISWHQKGLVPMGDVLTSDSRCSFVHADFFELAKNVKGSFDPESPLKKYDAILLDIDHTPTNLLSVTNKHFYTLEGLAELATHIKPDGVFSLWADGAPEESFADHLGKVFVDVKAHAIEFANPVNGSTSVGAVYVSRVKNSK